MGAERCWLVDAGGEPWLAREKTRLGNAACLGVHRGPVGEAR